MVVTCVLMEEMRLALEHSEHSPAKEKLVKKKEFGEALTYGMKP